MTDLVWEEPPTSTRVNNGKWEKTRAELVANPRRWARLRDFKNSANARSAAAHIRRGGSGWRPAGAYEAASRQNAVYVRYVGTDAADAE